MSNLTNVIRNANRLEDRIRESESSLKNIMETHFQLTFKDWRIFSQELQNIDSEILAIKQELERYEAPQTPAEKISQWLGHTFLHIALALMTFIFVFKFTGYAIKSYTPTILVEALKKTPWFSNLSARSLYQLVWIFSDIIFFLIIFIFGRFLVFNHLSFKTLRIITLIFFIFYLIVLILFAFFIV